MRATGYCAAIPHGPTAGAGIFLRRLGGLEPRRLSACLPKAGRSAQDHGIGIGIDNLGFDPESDPDSERDPENALTNMALRSGRAFQRSIS